MTHSAAVHCRRWTRACRMVDVNVLSSMDCVEDVVTE